MTNAYERLISKSSAIAIVREMIVVSKNDLKLSNEEILLLLKPLIVGNSVRHSLNMKLELLYWEGILI